MPTSSQQMITAVAVILVSALVGGRCATMCRIPRVTGYLLAGLLVGPSFAELVHLPPLITHHALTELKIISDVALALILMNIGSQLQTENLRRWKQRIFAFSLTESLLTGLCVASGIFICNEWLVQHTISGFSLLQSSCLFAFFTGTISIATAPAATLMVVREYEAEGPVTSTVLTLVGLNNLVSVFAFTIAVQLLVVPGGGLWTILYQLSVPLLLGGSAGLFMSLIAHHLELASEYKLLLLSGVISVAILSRMLGLEPLLSCLALGMILADSSPRWHRLVKALNEVDYPLYVVFFVLAGANLHIETLTHIGLLGIVYVVTRSGGKLLGGNLGARFGQFGQREQSWIGMTLLAQAGMAIGLAGTLAKLWPEGGKLVETIVLGSVVIFELIGPLAVRHGLVQAGEVPLLALLRKRAPQTGMEGLHDIANHFRTNLGLPVGHRLADPGDILVKHIMRHNVETIHHATRFNELLRIIAHSRYDRFPVVDDDNNFVGIINYAEIRNLLFDRSLAGLLVARDLVSAKCNPIPPDTPLREALKILQQRHNISYFPVIDPLKPNQLLGILSQNDVLAAFRRLDLDT